MNFAVGIIIGLFIGGTFGFLGSALCIASSNYNQVEELNNMLDDLTHINTIDKTLAQDLQNDYTETPNLYNQRKEV